MEATACGHDSTGNKKGVAAPQRQGFPYTFQAYFKPTQSYGITPSMLRRGNPYNNALTENFSLSLKQDASADRRSLLLRRPDGSLTMIFISTTVSASSEKQN